MRLGLIKTKIQEIKIAVRADSGSNIGMGHIQRCLALSGQLRKNGAKILFIAKKDRAIEKKIEQERFEFMALKDNIELEEDLKDTINAIKSRGVDVVITDSYAINEHYLAEIKRIAPLLVSIDDLANISFPSDIVINQNIYAKEPDYRSLTGKTKFLLGPQYALLREEFSNLGKRKINEKVKNILITLGGSDSFNLTPKILKILDRISQSFKITVIIGPFFRNMTEIEETAKEIDKNIELIYDSCKMSKIMLASDLAIAGGGTTLYELAATGTPVLAFCLADNQRRNIEEMAKAGTVIDIAWSEWQGERLYKEINELTNNYSLREKMSELGQGLVDGRGGQRVSRAIIENLRV